MLSYGQQAANTYIHAHVCGETRFRVWRAMRNILDAASHSAAQRGWRAGNPHKRSARPSSGKNNLREKIKAWCVYVIYSFDNNACLNTESYDFETNDVSLFLITS